MWLLLYGTSRHGRRILRQDRPITGSASDQGALALFASAWGTFLCAGFGLRNLTFGSIRQGHGG